MDDSCVKRIIAVSNAVSKNFTFRNKFYFFVKRCFDIVSSSLALIILSPFFLVIALIIFIDDPHGSPFFTQIRVGRNGHEFKLWKFRSMIVNAESMLESLKDKNEMEGPAFKIKNDPRITKIGRFIRKTSIDELPQLWNVLKGDMSVVGPRPPLPGEVREYTDYQKLRLIARPGLTCLWQVQPHRNDLSFDQWMELDIKYIKERSLWLDFKLIFKTVGCMFAGEGV